jgi:GNAT superfamily N-acetyltransferase
MEVQVQECHILGAGVLGGIDADQGERDDQKQKKQDHGQALHISAVNASITLHDNRRLGQPAYLDEVPGPIPLLVRRLDVSEWDTFRRIRLEALSDAPSAFSSTLGEARQLDEASWRARLEGRAQFIGLMGGQSVGTVGAINSAGGPELISMWVAPGARGKGVGDELVKAVVEWARNGGHARLHLWVAQGNVAAERLYTRHGFSRTGITQAMGEAQPPRVEFEMALLLEGGQRADR